MPSLPVLSGRQVVQVFVALGWHVARQRGSHIILVKPNRTATLSVPDHKEVAKDTLRSLIRAAGLTAEAFVAEAQKLREAVNKSTARPDTCVGWCSLLAYPSEMWLRPLRLTPAAQALVGHLPAPEWLALTRLYPVSPRAASWPRRRIGSSSPKAKGRQPSPWMRDLFRYQLDPSVVDEIRRTTDGNFALGNAAFAAQQRADLARLGTAIRSGQNALLLFAGVLPALGDGHHLRVGRGRRDG